MWTQGLTRIQSDAFKVNEKTQTREELVSVHENHQDQFFAATATAIKSDESEEPGEQLHRAIGSQKPKAVERKHLVHHRPYTASQVEASVPRLPIRPLRQAGGIQSGWERQRQRSE